MVTGIFHCPLCNNGTLVRNDTASRGRQKYRCSACGHVMIMTSPHCPRCKKNTLLRNGFTTDGKQKYRCRNCGHYSSAYPTFETVTRVVVFHPNAVTAKKIAMTVRLVGYEVQRALREQEAQELISTQACAIVVYPYENISLDTGEKPGEIYYKDDGLPEHETLKTSWVFSSQTPRKDVQKLFERRLDIDKKRIPTQNARDFSDKSQEFKQLIEQSINRNAPDFGLFVQ